MTPTEHIDELNRQAWKMRITDPAGAVELAEKAAMLARQGTGYPRGLGWSLMTLGACAKNAEDHQSALERLTTALELLAGCGDSDGEGFALSFIGNVQFALGEYRQSLENHRKGLRICQELGDRKGEANAFLNIGNVHDSLGEYAQALEHHHASLQISREIGHRLGEASALTNIGNVHYELGEYPQAIEYHQASLVIHREIGNRYGEAGTLTNIGNVEVALGEYPDALEHTRAGLIIFQETGFRNGEASALNNIGSVQQALGENAQALEEYQASLRIYQEIGDRYGQATTLTNIGSVHQLLGEYSQALEYHQASLRIHQEIGDRNGEANVLVNIASVYQAQGVFDAALRNAEAAVEIAGDIGSRAELVRAMLVRGRTYTSMNRPGDAIDTFEAVISLAVEMGEKPVELEAHALISREHEKLGNLARALEHIRRHIDLNQEVLGEETRRTIHRREMSWRIELARREAEIERLRTVELKRAFDELESAHAELKAAQSSLVQSEKMASLGQLTAGIAHEINNPINFVSASVRPIERNLGHLHQVIDDLVSRLPADEQSEYRQEQDIDETIEELDGLMRSVATGAARTAEIVAGLRSFSRLDEGGLKCVDLHEGLDATVTILSGNLSAGIDLEREYGELPLVECYPGEINQVFLNVLSNAIKAIEGSGRVTVRTMATGADVRIEISDTGCGMTPEVKQRIFEPFFTTRDVGEGRGLGLSIVWGIVEKHGGSIDVESSAGEGSRFIITLPVRPSRRSLDEGVS
jgi:two-component system, NtrC family, sensor kinase